MNLKLNTTFKILAIIISALFIIILLLKITDYKLCLKNQTFDQKGELNNDIAKNSFQPIIIYNNDNYKVYSFNSGINRLDLNFDGLEDYIFVSHINGADYYDYHTTADRDIYNFYINNKREAPLSSYWNIITKEIPNKKIVDFERDFVVPELLGCNGGGTLRIAQTVKKETLLILISNNQKEEDGSNTSVIFNIYKLNKSGNIAGSDYIFSFVKEVIGDSKGCGVLELGDKDIISAIQKAGF